MNLYGHKISYVATKLLSAMRNQPQNLSDLCCLLGQPKLSEPECDQIVCDLLKGKCNPPRNLNDLFDRYFLETYLDDP